MAYYSPLRYPGGKGKLLTYMKQTIASLVMDETIYIEPFAGGAGIATGLLLENVVDKIVINDFFLVMKNQGNIIGL